MKHIRNNPDIAIAGDWFTAKGRGIDLGYFGRKENERIALKMRELFSAWIDNGHKGISKKPVLSKKKQIGTVDARKAIEGVLSHSERD